MFTFRDWTIWYRSFSFSIEKYGAKKDDAKSYIGRIEEDFLWML